MVGTPSDLSFILDPAGEPGRPGINVRFYVSGESPIAYDPESLELSRTANNILAATGSPYNYEFTIEGFLENSDFNKLYALQQYKRDQRNKGRPYETVVYNLVEPFREWASTRTRYKVPGTDILEETTLNPSPLLKQWVYWVALQGIFTINYSIVGDKFTNVSLTFYEGTKLTAGMEV